jgi:hypothetical protein
MIDVLYSKLKACNDVSLAEWKDIEPRIYSKHSQAAQATPSVSQHSQTGQTAQAAPAAQTAPQVAQAAPQAPLNSLVSNVIPEAAKAAKAAKALKEIKKKPVKDTGVKPLDIIMTETISLNNSTEHIKDALITLISKEEFSKVFGLTKCAEIMSGVVNNRWNKSTALFISFLLDKEVYYNEKISLYNKEKNRGRITIP